MVKYIKLLWLALKIVNIKEMVRKNNLNKNSSLSQF